MPITNDDILRTLELIRSQRQQTNSYMKPTDNYRTFLPQTLGYTPPDETPYYHMLNTISEHGQNATDIAATRSQNRADFQQLQQAKKEERQTQRQLNHARRSVANRQPIVIGGNGKNNVGSFSPGRSGGVSLNPNAPIRTYNWRGHTLRLNSSVASHFIGFLNALYARGYRPKVIGSYANRNIAGTNVKSLHSLGDAIDIDPSRNPVTWNGHNITALPPGVGSLAARYGLKWGGSWIHNKRDTMHFSVPYGGRE